jgi:shikimate 5-dehydrogenase
VLGAGGAARAATFALKRREARVTLLARDPAKAGEAARELGCEHGPLASAAEWRFDAFINATPLGGGTLAGESPVPPSVFRPGVVAFDMVYEPEETRFLREAREEGAMTIGGLEMLLAQAVGQFEAWTGRDAPIDVMRQALYGDRSSSAKAGAA